MTWSSQVIQKGNHLAKGEIGKTIQNDKFGATWMVFGHQFYLH
jgi:hypothetical protein